MAALPAATVIANGTDFVSWRDCNVHTRSTFNILSLCLSTLIICFWNAVHPNVPSPKTPRYIVYLARIMGFLVGLFLPEMLVLSALNEFLDARWLMQEMNGAQSESLFTISYWKRLLKEMYPRALTMSYWTEAWRPNVATESDLPQWTMTRAFYVVMHGFFVKAKSSHQITYLESDEVVSLCKVDSGMRSLFAVDGFDDHSKAGALAKALLCWQLLVFAISCIARRAEHLPLSLLEITTLSHSLCGLAAFLLWWQKPHSVDEVVIVPIDDSMEEKIDWTENLVLENSAVLGLDFFIYADGDNLAKSVFSSLAVAALYGLPHLLGLSTEFPTLAERRCWQVATAIIIGTPVFSVALSWVDETARLNRPVTRTAMFLWVVTIILYVIASWFIIAESFRQLFALPSGAFLAPALVCYLPHFA